jgi:hypothetical protein
MSASEVSARQRSMCTLGGYSAISGAVIGMVGNLAHPATAGPDDPEATARVVAASQLWIPLHLPC